MSRNANTFLNILKHTNLKGWTSYFFIALSLISVYFINQYRLITSSNQTNYDFSTYIANTIEISPVGDCQSNADTKILWNQHLSTYGQSLYHAEYSE